MRLSTNRAFVNQFLVGLLVTIGFGGSVGVGTVWMRHRVSVLADTNRDLEQQYHEIERRVDDVSAQVESQLSPDILRAENEKMHLGLVEMTHAQISPVPVDPIVRLVAKANRRVFEQGETGEIAIQFNLPSSSVTPHGASSASVPIQPLSATPTAAANANRIQFAANP